MVHFRWPFAALLALVCFGLPTDGALSSSFSRDGNDQLTSASLVSGRALSFSYEASYGQMTEIANSGESGFRLELESDALLHLPVSQTITESGATLLSAAITYDAAGLRANRTVSAGSEGEGSSTTSYWYGGSLHPLVVTRDGITYRLIGKRVVEAVGSSGPTRSYLQPDHLGSTRVVTNDQGTVVQSLSYDDYGPTRIQGQSDAVTDDEMASFYRFQGQEQETFPLAKLSIDDSALAAWLDEVQLYHFPSRDYAAGLAAFTQTDPIPGQDSLYSAFAASPVNFTDETGGMFEYGMSKLSPQFYVSAVRNVPPRLQTLLDRLQANPKARFIHDLIKQLLFRVQSEENNSNNPFLADFDRPRLIWDPELGSHRLEFSSEIAQREHNAEEAFDALRQEQRQWLVRYEQLITIMYNPLMAQIYGYSNDPPSDEEENAPENAADTGATDALQASGVSTVQSQQNDFDEKEEKEEKDEKEEHDQKESHDEK